MAILKFSGVGVKALTTVVPKNIEKTENLTHLMSDAEIKNFIDTTGIKERHIIPDESVCSSDLCVAAAEKLFCDNDIDRSTIDMVIFMTQFSDYKVPATAPILQDRLGLPKSAGAFDMTLGCSGFAYGLATAFSYASNPLVNRVLFLDGEVNTKGNDKDDVSTWPLFGDAASALLVEKGDYEPCFFDLGSDGAQFSSIIIPKDFRGRNPVEKSLLPKSDLYTVMDGMSVFSFAISQVPKSVKKIYEVANISDDDIDVYLFHQANRFILQTVAKKLKIQMEKLAVNIDRYGNTSTVSIPLLLSSEFGNYGGGREIF